MNDKAKKILIVDDEQQFRAFLSDFFLTLGYKVVEESNALSVIRTIKKENPDLITLDLKMAGANGIQIVKTMKREGIDTPIIVISGYLGSEEIKKLVDLGVKHIISKPAKIDTIQKKVESILA